MAIKDILALVITLASFLLTCLIPTVIVMINRIKAVKNAKNKADKQAALSEIADLAKGFVVEAEGLYKSVDSIVKQNGGTCGAQKKDSVMTKILQACLTKGIEYDAEYWSNAVDELVAVTRQVNAK